MIDFSTFKSDFEAIMRSVEGSNAPNKRVLVMEELYQYVKGITQLCDDQKREALARVAELEKRIEAERLRSRQTTLI